MKTFQIIQLVLTALLLTSIAVFSILLLNGVFEVRRPSSLPNQELRQLGTASGAKARLLVLRGLRPNWEYPIYEGRNILGRADEQPVDIDLEPLEPRDRIWSSRQHAAIMWEADAMVIEDLNSANGTYVNRSRVPPGEHRTLGEGDVIQIGAVQLKVLK